MNDRVREDLLGYLLGALEDAEREKIEQQLRTDPLLQRELEVLREHLGPLDAGQQAFEPPLGLAERACSMVDGYEAGSAQGLSAQGLSPQAEPMARGRDWRLPDVLVGGGVCLAAALLFFPALFASWTSTKRAECQNNLRVVGAALTNYSEHQSDGRFPYIAPSGNRSFAGWFAQCLLDGGYLRETPALVCPSSDLSENLRTWRVPTSEEIDQARGAALIVLQRMSAGSYGYNLGVVENGVHQAPRNRSRVHFALMADAPSWRLGGRLSENHGGRGQNILFEDQHITFVVGCRVEPCGDDAFRNHRGRMEAGIEPNDSVIGPSAARPFLHEAAYQVGKY